MLADKAGEGLPPDLSDRLTGVLLGTAVGDAIGLPREGIPRQRAVRLFGAPPLGHRFLLRRGMVSDDTEHACMTAQALLAGCDDPQRFAHSLAWGLRTWFLALPAGMGMATARACIKLLLGWPPSRSGVYSAGNGPAMRAPIVGAFLHDRPDRLRPMVQAATRLTHTDPRAEEAAWVVARAAAYAVGREPSTMAPEEFLDALLPDLGGEELKRHLTMAREHLARRATADEFASALGLARGVGGYINHTVPAAIYCWLRYRGDFRATVEQTVMLGDDTDTTRAVVGALAGATVGASGIPEEWLQGLCEWPRDVGWIRRLGTRLAERAIDRDPARIVQPPPYFWPAVLPRNVLFLLVVLAHGLRRLLPPY